MAKIYVNYYDVIEVDSLEDFTLPGTSFKMIKVNGKIHKTKSVHNFENNKYVLKEQDDYENISIIINPNIITRYEE